ncbi:MAG: DUF1244 domain-containing protein [Myxococcota bacterium]
MSSSNESLLSTENDALQAAVLRRLIAHLQNRTDVQNIDLMNLAGFCRNCLSKWMVAEAAERGETLVLDDVREAVYGMPYGEWKAKYQTPATDAQKQAFEKSSK